MKTTVQFKAGDEVWQYVCVAGLRTREEKTVLEVSTDGVWLDNGKGNDPSGPFVDGRWEGPFGTWQEIELR